MGKDFKKKNNYQRNHQTHQKFSGKKFFVKKNRNDGSNVEDRKSTFTIKNSLKENQVGITEFINSGEGFVGILKSRFSDFHVNEIDLSGKVLHLNNLNVPEEKEKELSEEDINLAREELKDIMNEDVWNKLDNLKESKNITQKREDLVVYVEVTDLDKEGRTKIHCVVKNLYKNKLISSTISGEHVGKEADKKFIRFMKSNGRDRYKWTFPEEHVHFLVHKENVDTSEVASAMANKLNLSPSQVNYCGTKDRRAKTTQKFCIKKRSPRQIVDSVKYLNGVKIGNFEFSKTYLKLGDLKGNRFRIALRNVTGDRQHIETLLNKVKEQGFINYFGLQRFGNCSTVPTYEIGVALLKSDYKLACELILKPRDNDMPFLKCVREIWWKNRDSKAAASQIHSDRFIEKKLLDGLAQFGENDYASALRKIPRNMLLLYPHAFQSLIFNKVASRRIKEFGLRLIPGDLVYRNKNDIDVDMEVTELPLARDDEEKVSDDGNASNVNAEGFESSFKRKVKVLTNEDIESGSYTIYDVVLPLPGHDVTYPENVVESWYNELLNNYELSSEKLKHKVKLFAMAGAYRKLVIKPTDMSWAFRSYASPEENLILSDLELLLGKKLEDFRVEEKDVKYEALLLDFCLPTAAYATMMLREILKCDTSSAAQTLLQQTVFKECETIEKAQQLNLTHDMPIEEEEKVVASNGSVVIGEKRKANDDDDPVKSLKVSKDSEETN